ncbi:MAG: hypothetical protein QNJ31_04685 [Candidatus Caenarcaniphilales bacterium]|nr:hypothetical protein [Candidatus Caenarcaniphilales bacterium]
MILSSNFSANAQNSSPYNFGENTYGEDYLSTPPKSAPSSKFNDTDYSLGPDTQSPYNSLDNPGDSETLSTPLDSNFSSNSTSGEPPYTLNDPEYGAEGTSSPGPFEKVGQWIQRKTNRPTGQPELDLANQRIQAGKARIKAVKARQKLEDHIADCGSETDKLKRELQRAEEQASLLENQVRFQESNSEESTF